MAVDNSPIEEPDFKRVVAPGGARQDRNFVLDSHDLGSGGTGDFTSGVVSIGGASSVNIALSSDDSSQFDVELELYNAAGDTKVHTITDTEYAGLQAGGQNQVQHSVPVWADRVQVRVTDSSGSNQHRVSGTINVNAASVSAVQLRSSDDNHRMAMKQLQNSPASTASGIVMWGDRALNDIGQDEYVTRVTDSAGTQIDPLQQGDATPSTATDSGTGSSNAAKLDLGDLRTNVDIHVDTSGDATLTVEVSKDNSTWRTFDTVSYSGASQEIEQYDTAYQHIRAHLNQNRTLVEMSAKGVS